MKLFSNITRYGAAIIMLQTLYFKFTAQPESIYIFSQIGMEPWGRYLIGSMEFIASILLIWNRHTHLGAVLGTGLMAGALFFHFAILGFVVQNDGGTLFMLALATLFGCLVQVYLGIDKIIVLYNSIAPKQLHFN